MWIVAIVALLGVASSLCAYAVKLRQRIADLEEQAHRRNRDFLISSLSHELRTPLTAMMGFAEVARQPALEEERRNECLDRMAENGRRLLRLVNDVFDHARLNEGRLALHTIDCRLDDILDDVARVVRPEADRKGLLIALRVDDDVPQKVHVDPTRVAQVLRLVLDNAVKFTRRGHVGIRVENRGRTLFFRVHDTGPGVTSKARSGLFEPGRAGDQTHTRRHGGIGLGLGLARRLTALMEGTLSHESSAESGSVFTVELPLVRAVSTPDPAANVRKEAVEQLNRPRESFDGRVLIVEDSRDNQILVRHVLKQFGLESDIAENGRIALRALENKSYDLVLMDLQMPILDGYETTALIRKGGSAVPIVALTAHALSGERERCLEIGCDDFLTKPIDRRQLVRTLQRLLNPVPKLPVLAAESTPTNAS